MQCENCQKHSFGTPKKCIWDRHNMHVMRENPILAHTLDMRALCLIKNEKNAQMSQKLQLFHHLSSIVPHDRLNTIDSNYQNTLYFLCHQNPTCRPLTFAFLVRYSHLFRKSPKKVSYICLCCTSPLKVLPSSPISQYLSILPALQNHHYDLQINNNIPPFLYDKKKHHQKKHTPPPQYPPIHFNTALPYHFNNNHS